MKKKLLIGLVLLLTMVTGVYAADFPKQNITLANLRSISQRSVVDSNEEIQVATEYKDSINIKTS